MRALVIYRTRYGATARAAQMIRGELRGETHCIDLRKARKPDLSHHDVLLIGGSIYGGRMQRDLIAFCGRRKSELLDHRVGLFITCLYRGEKALAELNANFPDWLTAHAFARVPLGGRLRVDRLRLWDRLIAGATIHGTEDVDTLDAERVKELCRGAERAVADG